MTSPRVTSLDAHRATLADLSTVDLAADDPALGAARWYMRGGSYRGWGDSAVHRYRLDSLRQIELRPRHDRDSDHRRRRHSHLAARKRSSARRLQGEILHDGREQPDLLHDGYYVLEWIARLLLRNRHGLDQEQGVWPLHPGQGNLRSPFAKLAQALSRNPKTTIRRIEGGPPAGRPDDSSTTSEPRS